MTHDLLLPIADVIISPWLVIAIGFIGGGLTGLLGVGAGLFVIPALVTLGVPPVIAVASQVNSMIGITLTGYISYKKNSDVDYKLGRALISGGIPGAILGVYCLEWLDRSGSSKIFVTAGYALILSVMAVLLLRQSHKNLVYLKSALPEQKPVSPAWISNLPLTQYFPRSRLNISLIILLMVGGISGWLIAVLGVGNGVFMMPALIYFMGRTSPVAYGTTLLTSVVITIISTFVHALNEDFIDLILVALLLVGGLVGGHLGVKYSYKIPRAYLGIGGSFIMILILGQLAVKSFFPETSMLLSGNHVYEPVKGLYLWIQELGTYSPLLYATVGIIMAIVLTYLFQFIKIFFNKVQAYFAPY